MKTRLYAFGIAALVTTYLLSACGAATLPVTSDQDKIDVQTRSQDSTFEVAYTGVIEAIDGSQWMINGVELTIDSSVIQGGPFIVGDTVKIEGNFNSDGSFVVSQVLSPSPSDLTSLSVLGGSEDATTDNDNTNENINSNSNANDDDTINDNTNSDDDDDSTNNNTNSDDDDDSTNNNTNSDDDDDDNTNNNTSSDDDDSTNSNTNSDDDDSENTNGS